MSMTKREKFLIIFVLILAVVCVYYIYFLQPCLKETDELKAKMSTDQISLNTNELIKKNVEEIEQKISDDQTQISQFSSSIFSAFDQPAVLVYLFETISKYGQKVMISFNESGDMGQIKFCNVSVTLIGSYDALKLILKELSEGEYFVKVTGLSVSHVSVTQGVTQDNVSNTENTTSPSQTPQATEPITEATGDQENMGTTIDPELLNISLTLEFYYIGDEIPVDKTYTFTDGAIQYGGDIFH